MSTVLVVIVLLVVIGAVAGYFVLGRGAEEEQVEMVLTTVSRGPFEALVIAQGEVESSNNVEIRCEVKSRNSSTGTVILEVVPEGTEVKPGDLLARLDSTPLEQEMLSQQIVCNTVEATMIQAKNLYEADLIAKKEYEEGTFVQEEQRIQSELFVAQENLRRAQQYERYSERLAAKGYVTALQLEGDRFAVDKTQNELKTAETSLNVLREYTREKMMKTLDSNVASSLAKWKAEQSSYQLEMDKLKDLKDQIGKCEVRAPTAGTVVHANEFSSRGSAEFVLEPGALVRETQVMFRLPDQDQMQVKAKINEARITMVQRKNLPVAIKLDALSQDVLQGRLIRVNQYAEPRSWISGPIRVYAAYIKVLDPPSNLRPGMNAEVQIQVEKLDDALQVPVQTICEHKGKYFCLRKDGEQFQTVEVQVGSSNDKFMVIKSGLSEGETVVMNPRGFPDLLTLPDLPDPPPMISRRGGRGGGPGGSQGPGPSMEGRRGGPPSIGDILNSLMAMDTDGDDALSAEELQQLPEEQRQLTSAADADGDGKIDRAELTRFLAQQRAARAAERREQQDDGQRGGFDGGPRGFGGGPGGEQQPSGDGGGAPGDQEASGGGAVGGGGGGGAGEGED